MKQLDLKTLEAISNYLEQVALGYDYVLLLGDDSSGKGKMHVLSNLPPLPRTAMAVAYLNAAAGTPVVEGQFENTKH